MKPALGTEGRAALAHVMACAPLLAFDFDGTLAPIVARPQDARVPLPVARRLAQLSERLPVAVVTGRAVDDVAERLGFAPRFLVGSHGAESPTDTRHMRPTPWAQALEPARERLRKHAEALSAAGVQIEDKRHSIALHYRLAPDAGAAVAVIEAALTAHGSEALEGVRFQSGKFVVNLMAADAPDKGDAVRGLVTTANAGTVLFIGDDANDEPVFVKAQPDWMTIRIGHDGTASSARFYLDGPSQVATLLQSAIDLMRAPAGVSSDHASARA